MPRCGILRSRKRPERVNRNEQCERSKRSRAKIEAADRRCFSPAGGLDLPATSIGALTTISMVATPHWGACSLSIDLTSDEISATGGHQRFALERIALLVSVRKRTRTADGIPVPRTARVRTPPRFRLWRMTHWVTTRIVPHFARNDILGHACGHSCFILNP